MGFVGDAFNAIGKAFDYINPLPGKVGDIIGNVVLGAATGGLGAPAIGGSTLIGTITSAGVAVAGFGLDIVAGERQKEAMEKAQKEAEERMRQQQLEQQRRQARLRRTILASQTLGGASLSSSFTSPVSQIIRTPNVVSSIPSLGNIIDLSEV